MRTFRHIEKYEVTGTGEWLITLKGGFEIAPEVTTQLILAHCAEINICDPREVTLGYWLLTLDAYAPYREIAIARTLQLNAEKLKAAATKADEATGLDIDGDRVESSTQATKGLDVDGDRVENSAQAGTPRKITFVPPVELVINCIVCGIAHKFLVMRSSLDRFMNGEVVDKCFPYLNAAQREMLLSRICGKCWDDMFSNGDDDMDE